MPACVAGRIVLGRMRVSVVKREGKFRKASAPHWLHGIRHGIAASLPKLCCRRLIQCAKMLPFIVWCIAGLLVYSSLRTADVFPVVASLPPKNNVVFFRRGEKRRPSLFTNPVFSLQSLSSAGDKI